MKAILLPVKTFRRSKERLSPHHSDDEREALARALCEDTLRTVAQVKGVNRVYVVSAEYHALSLARQLNWHVIDESEQVSESASVDSASRQCARDGVKALLRLPIDLPLITPSDIEMLFYFLEPPPSVVIVPSADGTGTNALLRSPPDLFPSRFGPNSFELHLKEAEKVGAKVAIVRNERIALDIDEPKDLRAAAGRVSPHSATARLISQLQIRATD
jgi:2-phospho-L-lactate guanylyltransferase